MNGTAITENTFTIKEDSKVAVVLAPITYSIGYTLNGGTADNPTAYTVESDDFTLTKPTKTGYTFTGWTGSNDLTTPDETVTIAQGSTGNRTYTANWKANTYTVIFDANDGDGTMESQSYTYDSAQAIKANTFTRKGYTFAGWNTSSDASGTSYTDGQNVSNLAAEGEVTLYAKWTAITYTITYTLDGGSLNGDATNPATYTVETDTFTLNNPTKNGYNFVGWTGTDLDGAVTAVKIAQGSTGNREYTANWTKLFTPSPAFAYHSMILSGQIGVIFYVYAPGIESSDCYVYFDVNGDQSENTQPVYAFEEITDNGYTLYGYKCYINAIQMADEINAVFHYGDNKTVTHTYTAAEYLSGITQETTQTADTIALGKAIMDFGHYVQPVLASHNGWEIGKHHAEMTPANDYDDTDFTATETATQQYAITNTRGDSSGISDVKFALILDSETTIELYLTPKDDYTGEVYAYLDGGNINMAVKDGGQYTVSIGNISAHKLGETHTIEITTKYPNADSDSFTVKFLRSLMSSQQFMMMM